ncbi:MAG: FAD-dependent oxidoreductase [Acidobacteriota bacterium]|nr:FAD-dependent oxidoreductase [Acidobacteriota bacterium]
MDTAQAKWPVFKTKLISRTEIAEGTMSFRFERPPAWTFKAGQFVDITLLNPPVTDAEGNVRGFSIASAPHEDTIMVATRMRNTACKQVLATMPIKTEVQIEGPFGDLSLHNKVIKPAVLLAGGIGVTPFHSIVLRAAHDRLEHRIVLFHSNNTPEDAPFLEELRELEKRNPFYKYVPTMTAMERSKQPWSGETGPFSAQMLAKHLKAATPSDAAIADAIYYIAGPPGMVAAMRKTLVDWRVDEDNIRTEEFAGY